MLLQVCIGIRKIHLSSFTLHICKCIEDMSEPLNRKVLRIKLAAVNSLNEKQLVSFLLCVVCVISKMSYPVYEVGDGSITRA
jgi:hypothetical protein